VVVEAEAAEEAVAEEAVDGDRTVGMITYNFVIQYSELRIWQSSLLA
jgi:hypothetical protein